jgi:hypothetical protein
MHFFLGARNSNIGMVWFQFIPAPGGFERWSLVPEADVMPTAPLWSVRVTHPLLRAPPPSTFLKLFSWIVVFDP